MEEKEIHVSDYLRIINKRRSMIILSSLAVFMMVAVYTFTTPPKYKATTKLLIENIQQDPLDRDSRDNRRDPEFMATQYQIIKSKSVARKVVDQLSLDSEHASFFVKNPNNTATPKTGLRGRAKEIYEKLLKIFQHESASGGNEIDGSGNATSIGDIIAEFIVKNIEVIPVRTSRIVDISFSTSDPDLSMMIVNALAKAYMDEILDIRLNIANYKLNWMNEKARTELEKLTRSEHDLQTYMQENGILPIESGLSSAPQKLSELNSQLILAETKRKELEILYNQVRKIDTENMVSLPSIASNPAFLSLKSSILEAEQNIMELSMSKKYGEQHPSMITARSNLDGLKKLQLQEVKNIVDTIRTDLELARLNEENLKKSLEQARKEAIQFNEKLIQYNILKREIETNRNLYEALITNLKEQSLIGEIQTINVWVLEAAKAPNAPYTPKIMINLLIGLIMGIGCGVGVAFFIEYFDTTIKFSDEIEDRLGLPLLGTVFFSKLKRIELIESMISNPNSPISERYKAIRASIMLSSADNKPKTLLVTSASPDDGKTLTSINLSLAMVHYKHKVLLIDADLRNPQLHIIFGLDNSEGLSTFAAGLSQKDIIQPGPLPGLDIITSGPKPPNPSEIISSQIIQEMIQGMKQNYDMIIVDSAPALHVTDSLILSKVVDATVLVIRAGKTDYTMARDCVKSFKDINSRLLGIIFNALNLKENSYYGGYGNYGDAPTAKKKMND